MPLQVDGEISGHGNILRQVHILHQKHPAGAIAGYGIVRAADGLDEFLRGADVVIVQLAGWHEPDVPIYFVAAGDGQIVSAGQNSSTDGHRKKLVTNLKRRAADAQAQLRRPLLQIIYGRDLPSVKSRRIYLEVIRQIDRAVHTVDSSRFAVLALDRQLLVAVDLLQIERIARHLHGHIKRHRPRGKAIDGFGLRKRCVMHRRGAHFVAGVDSHICRFR